MRTLPAAKSGAGAAQQNAVIPRHSIATQTTDSHLLVLSQRMSPPQCVRDCVRVRSLRILTRRVDSHRGTNPKELATRHRLRSPYLIYKKSPPSNLGSP